MQRLRDSLGFAPGSKRRVARTRRVCASNGVTTATRGEEDPGGRRSEQAQHPGDMGRRYWHHQSQLLQRRADGLPDPEHRPAGQGRDEVHRLLRRAELYGGSGRVHQRPERVSHRHEQGRGARHRRRPVPRGPHDRRATQAAGLRHRPVRQEPPGRSSTSTCKDQPRLLRVLRQPLPPQRRGGARDPGLSRRRALSGAPRHPKPAGRHPLVGHRRGRR